jgi:hypothetical protein
MVAGTFGDSFSMRTCVIVVMLRGNLATYGWGYGRGTHGFFFHEDLCNCCYVTGHSRNIRMGIGGTLGDCFSIRNCVIVRTVQSVLFFLKRFFCIKRVLRLDFLAVPVCFFSAASFFSPLANSSWLPINQL